MKTVCKSILILLLMLNLNSCAVESNYDINEIIKKINISCDLNLTYEDFIIQKSDYYIYSTIINNDTLLRLYCNNKNEIVKCTVTNSNDTQKKYVQICNTIINILNNNAEIKQKNNPEKWKSTEIDTAVGKTFVINKSQKTINSDEILELKEPIDENKITRPKKHQSSIQDIIP